MAVQNQILQILANQSRTSGAGPSNPRVSLPKPSTLDLAFGRSNGLEAKENLNMWIQNFSSWAQSIRLPKVEWGLQARTFLRGNCRQALRKYLFTDHFGWGDFVAAMEQWVAATTPLKSEVLTKLNDYSIALACVEGNEVRPLAEGLLEWEGLVEQISEIPPIVKCH